MSINIESSKYNDEIKKVLSKVKARRLFKNYNQVHLAKKLNITQHGYSKLESGESVVTIEKLFIISEVLGVDIRHFF